MFSVGYILNLVGRDSFIKGRLYFSGYIKSFDINKLSDCYQHIYKVKSERRNMWYDVEIKNNGNRILDFNCNCPQFAKNHTCKHVAAVLVEYGDDISEFEIIDEISVSKLILNEFSSNTKRNGIREKLDIEIEFSFDYGIFLKVSIGNSKKYKLSTISKLRSFLRAYSDNQEYQFGKALIYSSDKYYFSKTDVEVIKFLDECFLDDNRYYSNNSLGLTVREFGRLLKIIGDNSFDVAGYGKVYNICEGFPTGYILNKDDDNYILSIDDYDNYVFLDDRYVLYNHNLYILDEKEAKYIHLLKENKISELKFSSDSLSSFNNGLFNNMKNHLVISDDIDEIAIPVKPSVKIFFDIAYSKLKCNIIFVYKDKEINYFDESDLLRDNDYENLVSSEIVECGFFEDNKTFIMDNDDDIYSFIDEGLNKLSLKYEVFTSKRIDNTKILKGVSTTSNFSIGKDGIMSYSFSAEGIDKENLNDIFIALKQKKRYYKLKNNNVIDLSNNDSLNELNSLASDLDLSSDDINSGDVVIPKYRALYIDSLKKNKYKNIKTNSIFNKFITNFKKYKNLDIDLEEDDFSKLRDYQRDGVRWLKTIYKCDFGGILADEMGLGKSIQTIMFIKEVLMEKPDSKIIIVVPTSLIYNWEKEFLKFAPNLRYVVVADNKQKRMEIFEKKDDYNIFITSYGLIKNDKDEYESMDFELCIVDEAQNIKNYQALMTKEVKKIRAKCKIALTGTPVENNVMELWSIFDYIMPGYLNNVMNFRKKYNIKDVDEDGLKTLKLLNYQIKPFILRRKKCDVISSLPKKIVNNIYIDLPEKQKMLYLKVLNDTKNEMDEMIRNGGFQKSRMKILQLLTRLRQICIDPSVMYDNYDGESIKLDELLRIVKENVDNGHKMLIFSSFKRILDNVSLMFSNNNISYYKIDGSVKSKDRMDMVEKFNNDDTNCFLITLKSGGTGLNLVGADTVIHLDIWWNPQVENQATDRAHRIGQSKTVSVIKLVTRGTIEEKIIELQNKKKILSENLIEGKSDSENLSSLSEKDIINLLSMGE